MDLNFFKFSKIAAEMSKIADFEFFFMTNSDWQESENSKNGQIFKNKAIFGNLTAFENEQFFSMHFYSITHMKVGNPFIFVKLL